MSEPELTPQEPGVPATADVAKLEAVLAKAQKHIPAELDALDNDELALLRAMEVGGKARVVVLKAIDTLIGSRAVDGEPGPEIEGASNANLGDRERYARMHASEVDRSKIPTPVLTLDGWVLPLNRATEVH